MVSTFTALHTRMQTIHVFATKCGKYKTSNPPIPYNIVWDIVARAEPFNPATGYCDLCTEEKYRIMFEPEGASLNQRSEFFAYCYHQRPQLLTNYKPSDVTSNQHQH